MIRLLIWFIHVVIIGRKQLPRPPMCPICEGQDRWGSRDNRAVAYCAAGLCAEHCDYRCKCIADYVAERKELMRHAG